MVEFQIKRWRVSDLRDWPKNPRVLTEKGMRDLEASLRSLGNASPATVNADGTILGGHARKKIYIKLGWEWIDCWTATELIPEEQIPEYNIRLNKNIGGEFDFDILANEFEIGDLLNYGFEAYEIGITTHEAAEAAGLPSMGERKTNEIVLTIFFDSTEKQDEFLQLAPDMTRLKRVGDYISCKYPNEGPQDLAAFEWK